MGKEMEEVMKDTMVIMNRVEEFREVRDWVADSLNMDVDTSVNLFETTIRVLGGLLATYHLTSGRGAVF